MKDMFHVSASPHIRSEATTAGIMRDVAIALIPASAWGVYRFGLQALLVMLVSITSCVLSEYAYKKLMKKPKTPYECSALVTGLLLGMNLPATVPLWIPIVGGIFAIIVVKELYGGLGQNFMNPALAARCFLLICFAGRMTDFQLDGVSGATPLAIIKGLDSGTAVTSKVSLFDMFFGFTGGVIGEVSTALILLGAAYLLVKKVISLRIPLAYLITFSVFLILFSGRGLDFTYLAAQLCGGGLMLGAWFMATDYVTSPITKNGQIIFGILLGILTGLFRVFGNNAEGVSYAIIFCNMLVPLIEKVTIPKAFGKGGSGHGKKN